ncbi:membrane protein [Planobispora rosea]|uniref:Membrane protein n=1 Tax=Planobispora rosea TaxID=35762 RepID=A0A8J3WEL9_PLARO|nr:MBL fold metallo-hydrolase [Planobispora rosea]GGS84293.1 membrane protein [Planobispora rosea]GIH86373.1 membrane protein [Planobispora rosea]
MRASEPRAPAAPLASTAPRRWPRSFHSRRTHDLPSLADLVRVQLQGGYTLRDLSDADRIPIAARSGPLPVPPPHQAAITWAGHSSVIIQLGERTILCDPVWTHKIFGVRPRLTPPGIAWHHLPPIDAVLLSHDHSDHTDPETLRRLPPGTPILAPAGMGTWLRRRGLAAAAELDWWQHLQLGGLQITCVPAHHWSGRTPWGLWRSLWCGWVITDPATGTRIYFAGDTAYGPCFTEIGQRFPGIDVALMPTGSYAPRWFQRSGHVDPAEAVQAVLDVGARALVPIHWGTFVLGSEPLLAPLTETRAAWARSGQAPEDLWTLAIGQTRYLTAALDAPPAGCAARSPGSTS